jgi:threonine synthase
MTRYYSTNRSVPEVDLAEALLTGQAGDKGLFMPRPIPKFSDELMARARDLAYPELAVEVLWPYVEGVFPKEVLVAICHDAYDYDVPLEHVDGTRHVMRLDRGPTASFKDFAARFMGRAIGRLVRERGTELLLLTATSGDTGSAVANAFLGVDGIRALVLFPIDEVSNRQRKQMTTLGGNVATLALPGKFDDCQALVKQAFADPELAAFNLSSANSINIGRLLPQSVYYVYSASRLADIADGEPVVFSVPSGNFGDMMGGMLSLFNGLPVAKFVIATNENDEVPRFFATGSYEKIVPSRTCISNAMNVGHPSNLARLVDAYGGQMDELGNLNEIPDMGRMRHDIYAVSIDDDRTRRTIGDAHREHGLLLEPHGAVGWAGLESYLELHPEHVERTAIALETAHPAKFPEEIRSITGVDPPVPPSLEGLEDRTESYGEIGVDYAEFKNYLTKEYGP